MEHIKDAPGYFILRNMLPAGLFYYVEDGKEIRILLDYVIPAYRDGHTSAFLFGILSEEFSGHGLHAFKVQSSIPDHTKYLRRVGFEPIPTGDDQFQRVII